MRAAALFGLGLVALYSGISNARSPSGAENWPTLGRDTQQTYFSPLNSINEKNVSRLGFAWSYELGTSRGQEATPIVIDGVMYTSGYIGITYAVDAGTGRELWRFTPRVNYESMRDACCDAVNRGVAVHQGRVYVASIDGQLHALDAATGREIWSVDTIVDHTLPYSTTGAPVIAHDVVVIGNSGGDMGHGGVRGYVSAYDLKAGEFKWRFFTVPPAPGKPFEHEELALAAKSWAPHRDAIYPGGATVWDGMTYDPTLNLLYFGTGNAAPTDSRKLGPGNGDMLFACSILALHPDTGKMAWYYQTTPGDKWDFDATQKLVLADLRIRGHVQPMIMQANKNGFFYVLDRTNGKLIAADKFTYVTWADRVRLKDGRPVVAKRANYYDKPSAVYPSTVGAHSWQPMSFDPLTKLVYIPVIDMSNVLYDLESTGDALKYINGSFTVNQLFVDDDFNPGDNRALPPLQALRKERPDKHLMRELIRAWDPVARKIVWEHETASGSLRLNGGILSTAGNLVFQGNGEGTLTVYAAGTGRVLKSLKTGNHLMAAPISYAVNGEQYIAIQAGYGGSMFGFPETSAAFRHENTNRVLTFKLGGVEVPKLAVRAETPLLEPPSDTADQATIKHGEVKYNEECGRCHAFGPGLVPDLRNLPESIHERFNDVVLRGLLAPAGMERFDDVLSESDVDAIHAFLIDQQRQLFHARSASK